MTILTIPEFHILWFFPLIWIVVFSFQSVIAIKTLKQHKFAVKHLLSLIASPFLFIILTGLTILLLELSKEKCRQTVGETVSMFNGHLKELCRNREDKSECPKNVSQLIAFNPQQYKNMSLCTKSYYTFNAIDNSYSWIVFWSTDSYFESSSKIPGSEGFTYRSSKYIPSEL